MVLVLLFCFLKMKMDLRESQSDNGTGGDNLLPSPLRRSIFDCHLQCLGNCHGRQCGVLPHGSLLGKDLLYCMQAAVLKTAVKLTLQRAFVH